jgi:penicillin-binding protein-related factor A (putative recombinase)
MTAANRGKTAEAILQKEFKKLDEKDAFFTFERIYDARSSKGAMANPRTGDFVLYNRGDNTVLEVKEVDHEYRLPRANFSKDQRARMVKRHYAGSICLVAVYFTPIKAWRLLELSYFGSEDTGSWDMRDSSLYDLPRLLAALYEEPKLRKVGWKP